MFNSLWAFFRVEFSLKTATAAIPVGGYGVLTSSGGLATDTVVFAALVLTILLQIHRLWYFYSPIIENACSQKRMLYVGQIIAFAFSAVVAISIILALAHHHLAAELVIASQQCFMLTIILVVWFGNDQVRSDLLPWLANELMHVVVLGWLLFVTIYGQWNDNKIAEFSVIVAVVIVSCHYLVHLWIEERISKSKSQNQS